MQNRTKTLYSLLLRGVILSNCMQGLSASLRSGCLDWMKFANFTKKNVEKVNPIRKKNVLNNSLLSLKLF